MINEKEIEQVSLSATKKDFYQIWNELLEVAGKLSERWDPTSTNEADPGIVLLKVLTAIADKLNYTIDKNTLEAFLPSAAQEESMRKLCDMLGYSMKYYQSATTEATFAYIGEPDIEDISITIPKYTNLKNTDADVNYFTLEDIILGGTIKSQSVDCMEGTVVKCSEDTDYVISVTQLDDNNRYYLPESQIAENGIFITNYNDSTTESDLWEKVDNLNTQQVGKQCYKFGFDSLKAMPYIQFPDDISTIIEDGLVIRYTRTNGGNGNISARTLSTFEEPEDWQSIISEYEAYSDILVVDNFTVTNASAAVTGKDKESLNDAYNNYKKIIGTFDTLVTCRDYMNKIYLMTTDDANTTPLVSNIIVSDIRDDINKAYTLCTFNNYGIAYADHSFTKTVKVTADTETALQAKTSEDVVVGDLGYVNATGKYYQCTAATTTGSTWEVLENFKFDSISHFDLVLYPFTTITGTVSKAAYDNSFKYSTANKLDIEQQLEDTKTISHNIIYPDSSDLVCIKNYLKLKAKVTTKAKVNSVEEAAILSNIYSAIYENFNARKLDFSEEIPFDSILTVIQEADTRIKNVALDEPYLYTRYQLADGTFGDEAYYYNKLAIRNVLAGRIPLFNYDESFEPDFTESKDTNFDLVYGKINDDKYISKITSDFSITAGAADVVLDENEVVQFRAPNFKTTKTYPAYINYYIHLKDATRTGSGAIPATFTKLKTYLDDNNNAKWTAVGNYTNLKSYFTVDSDVASATTFDTETRKYGRLFTKSEATSETIYIPATTYTEGTTYYYCPLTDDTFGSWDAFIKAQTGLHGSNLLGLYRSLGADTSRQIGKMVDGNFIKYMKSYQFRSATYIFESYYVQATHTDTIEGESGHTTDGLGRDATYSGIKADEEYYLDSGEYLLINYTPSTTDSDGNTTTGTPVNLTITNQIIKPNFDLLDSDTYHTAGHTATKTENYNFDSEYMSKINSTSEGLYTLDSDQQIEIREPVEIYLNDSVCYVYWERNDESSYTADGYVTFNFDEPYGGVANMAYTLKEGEYFYYTDANKLDMAYYGNGTRIIKSTNTQVIRKTKQSTTSLADDIANYGLLAALPWEQLNLNNTDKKLTIKEYQYITLTEGDTLCTVGLTSTDPTKIEPYLSSANWTAIKRATYKLSTDEDGTTTNLPLMNVNNATWEVKSILNINSSPTIKQTLHKGDKTTDKVTLVWSVSSISDTVLTATTTTPVSFKTNYVCQTSNGTYDTHIYKYNSDGTTSEALNDFAVKVFDYKAIEGTKVEDETSTVSIDTKNFGDGHWTKLSFKSAQISKFDINTVLPSSTTHHGLIMFYYIDEQATDNTKTTNAYLTAVNGTTQVALNICNAKNRQDDSKLFDNNNWWKDYKSGNNYYLKPGINIVEIPDNATITIHADAHPDAASANSTIIFSNLDLVKLTGTELDINPRIDYQSEITGVAIATQLLKAISKIDKTYSFYYNNVVDNSLSINLNTNITDTDSDLYESLSTPAVWYDYNNINNKFVISEIESDTLEDGIIITNSSKR